jgi:RND family efflux transporter MFP subunit
MKSALYAVTAIALIATSCTTQPTTSALSEYEIVRPVVTDTAYTQEYVAEIIALQNVEVRARQKGFIEQIHVDEGQRVTKGQTLFTMSSRVLQQELVRAKATCQSTGAELRAAEIELTNAHKLLEKNVISATEYQMAEAKVEALRAKCEEAKSDEAQAQLRLSFTEIKAPFDGIINRILNKTGSLIEEGELLTTISDNSSVLAYFHLSEKEYLEYVMNEDKEQAKKVELLLANGQPFAHPGIIETTESEFDPTTGNIAFRVKFPNPDGLLKHGANGKVVIRKKLKDALLIPQKSTFEIQDKLFVYVLKGDSTVEQRNIESTLRLPHVYVVDNGLSANDRILYEGIESVSAGMKIVPQHLTVSFIN